MNRTYAACLALVWTVSSQGLSGHTSLLEEEASSRAVLFLASIPDLGIHVIREDGERLIYYHQGTYISPRISPDRNQILLHSRRGGRIGIWLGDIEGRELRRLCDGDQANWSPDGRKIVFRREGGIFERDFTSGEERKVSPPEFSECMFPSYLSEGCFLFVSQENIYTIGAASSDARLLANGEIRSAPRASADGSKVVWQNGAHLTLLDLEIGKSTQLTTHGGIQSWPVWSENGEYLSYCQSPLPEGPWDLYVTAPKNPEKTWLIRRDIHPSPDWSGLYAPDSTPESIVGSHLTVRASQSPLREDLDGQTMLQQVDHWRDVGAPQEAVPLVGDILIENSWLAAICSSHRNSVRLFLKEGPGTDRSVEISPLLADRDWLKEKPEIRLESYDQDNARLSVLYRSGESIPIRVDLRIPENRPYIELGCDGPERISLKTEIRFALIPDRFAEDLIINPQKANSSEITLPYTPLLFAPLREESGMMMVVTPDRSQKLELHSGEQSNVFDEMVISTGGKKVFLSLLGGNEGWQELEARPTGTEHAWQVEWTHPFLAQWRIAAMEGEQGYSRMWNEESLSRQSASLLPIDASFVADPEPTVIYLFGRSWHTPLQVITPMELLIDAVGFEQGSSLLDEEGIRSFRTANGPVSFREISTRQEEWNRELVHVDSRDPNWVELGVLESMQGVRATDTPGVRSLITHFGKDIVSILEGLDSRIDEYENLLNDLRAFCRSNETLPGESAEFFAVIDQEAAALQKQVEEMPVSPATAVTNAIENVQESLGTGKYLHSTQAYSKLSQVVRAAQTERQEVVRTYREFVKRVRSKAGQAVTNNSSLKAVGDELRTMTQDILRNRYYLERDWNGETPLRKDAD